MTAQYARRVLALAVSILLPISAHAASFNWQKYKGQTIEVLVDNNPIGKVIATNADAFEKLTGITLKVDIFTEQQMRQRLVTVLDANSNQIDVFMTLPSREGAQFAKAGWYTDLTPMTGDVSSSYDFNGLSPALLKAATINGKLTSIPMNIEGPVLYYRADILRKCHVAVPATLADLELAAQKIKACDPSVTPFVSRGLRDALPYTYSAFFHNMGGQYIVDGKSGLCSPQGLAALKLYGDLLRQFGPLGVVNYSFYQISSLYRDGRAAMAFESSNELSDVMQGGARLGDTGVALLPPGPGGSHPTAIDWGLAMSPYSTHKGAAWYLIQWATSPDMQAKNQLAGIAAPRASIAKDRAVQAWLKAEPVRTQWQQAVSELATTGTSDVGYPIVDNPESRQYIGDAVDNVIVGTKTPAAACGAADASLNTLIAKDGG
ncbi:MAG: ABC transporter substrate-binding protein [Rhodospirillales bacterium 20-60-12]|nr:MAG: ABC transporter substrate-binding protein [Rhodospirillales bacterium 20-60-12]HQT66710.1 sugar ABC transporter substrate-binding protein [Acetobacteraceae bacterium]